jgi:hypothetical protein
MRRYLLSLVIATMGLGTLLVAGCSSGSSDTAGQLAALSIVDSAGFHAMDQALNGGDGKIDPQWLGKVRHGQTAVAAIKWPSELAKQAKAFTDAAEKFATTIEADSAATAAPAAKANHEAWHELTTDAWELLSKNAGIKVAGHDEGTATPTATATAR